jgi:hypothetical protein
MSRPSATVSVGICLATLIGFGVTDRAVAGEQKACGLVSAAEITQIVGFKVDAGVPNQPLPHNDTDLCRWKGSPLDGRVIIWRGVQLDLYDAQVAQRTFEGYSHSQPTKDVKIEPITGVGTKAVGTYLTEGEGTYTVHVADGRGGFDLTVDALPTAEQTKPLTVALAKLIESRR